MMTDEQCDWATKRFLDLAILASAGLCVITAMGIVIVVIKYIGGI